MSWILRCPPSVTVCQSYKLELGVCLLLVRLQLLRVALVSAILAVFRVYGDTARQYSCTVGSCVRTPAHPLGAAELSLL
eukprot:COSAG01_NODE_2328_length_7893_cov_2.389017_1_plen_79_part_00